jgi:uracil DNA glycosylase
MEWNNFKNKFHTSWHASVKPFIESNHCNLIYSFLKKQKGKEIAPKSSNTFRAFEVDLKKIRCVIIFDEPYSCKQNDLQYADGIPLSCEYVDKIHPQLIAFYEAMETEFYNGLNINMIKRNDLEFLRAQGVLFISSSLTTEINSPGKHKNLWTPFIKHIITKVFVKRMIPIVFAGENVFDQYAKTIDPVYPYFVIKQSISDTSVSVPWNTNEVFSRLNKYLWDKTDNEDVMWVNMDVPF